jgi:hypothetical protein
VDVAKALLLSDGQTLYDPKTWKTKKEASELLGIATKTIERWVEKGLLSQETIKPPMQREMSVYHIDDLKRARDEKQQHPVNARREPTSQTKTPATVQGVAPLGQKNGALVTRPGRQTPATQTFPTLPASVWEALMSGRVVPLREKIYLTMDEARAYTGLPKNYLEEAVAKRKVKKVPNRWLLRRADLEKL